MFFHFLTIQWETHLAKFFNISWRVVSFGHEVKNIFWFFNTTGVIWVTFPIRSYLLRPMLCLKIFLTQLDQRKSSNVSFRLKPRRARALARGQILRCAQSFIRSQDCLLQVRAEADRSPALVCEEQIFLFGFFGGELCCIQVEVLPKLTSFCGCKGVGMCWKPHGPSLLGLN